MIALADFALMIDANDRKLRIDKAENAERMLPAEPIERIEPVDPIVRVVAGNGPLPEAERRCDRDPRSRPRIARHG